MIDNYGRTIDYMRISVTELCNLRCRYCMPEEGIVKRDHAEMMTAEGDDRRGKGGGNPWASGRYALRAASPS